MNKNWLLFCQWSENTQIIFHIFVIGEDYHGSMFLAYISGIFDEDATLYFNYLIPDISWVFTYSNFITQEKN